MSELKEGRDIAPKERASELDAVKDKSELLQKRTREPKTSRTVEVSNCENESTMEKILTL